MSENQPITQIPDPDLRALLNAHRAEIFGSFNAHQVGEVVSFDEDVQTATVKISLNKQVVDFTKSPPAYVYLPYPLLTDCPVYSPSGGKGWLTFPVTAGDPCLVLFNDRDLDNWFEGGGNVPPNSDRKHDLSDGLVIVGFRSRTKAIPDFYMDGAELRFDESFLRLAAKVKLANADTDLKAVLTKVVLALTALDAKTGPSAAVPIAAVTTEINKLLQ